MRATAARIAERLDRGEPPATTSATHRTCAGRTIRGRLSCFRGMKTRLYSDLRPADTGLQRSKVEWMGREEEVEGSREADKSGSLVFGEPEGQPVMQ
jgi:hypothetical protein